MISGKKIAAALLGVSFFFQVPWAFAETRNVLQEEVEVRQKLARDIENLVKQRKIDDDGGKYLENLKKAIVFLQARLEMLRYEASSHHFTVYAATQEAADRYLKTAEEALEDYNNFFPNLNFNPSTPAQLILYPDYAQFKAYEAGNAPILGHALSNRQTSIILAHRGNRYVLEQTIASSQKYHRLATYQEENPYVFVHEVCHILTFEMINPQELDLNQLSPNRLLNEGLSEFFAARHNPDVFKNRVRVLIGGKTADGVVHPPIPAPNILELLAARTYPHQIAAFYSEGTLFTKWIMDFPSGAQLYKFLLTADPSQMEALLRTHQRTNGLPDVGFAAYYDFRQKTLEELEKSFTNETAAAISSVQ